MRRTARSESSSEPTNCASKRWPPASTTSIRSAPLTTWALVTIVPSLSIANPDPSPASIRDRPPREKKRPSTSCVWTVRSVRRLTTDGSTRCAATTVGVRRASEMSATDCGASVGSASDVRVNGLRAGSLSSTRTGRSPSVVTTAPTPRPAKTRTVAATITRTTARSVLPTRFSSFIDMNPPAGPHVPHRRRHPTHKTRLPYAEPPPRVQLRGAAGSHGRSGSPFHWLS